MGIFKSKKIDVLSIGDISVDNFIKIKEAETKCDANNGHCELCFTYGGKIPYESSEICYATGNSSNVAISMSRLGLQSSLMSNIGFDENGYKCLDKLKKEKVDISLIKRHQNTPTNFHYILWYITERTILTKHEKYQYEWIKNKKIEGSRAPSWIYLSSLGENSLSFYNEIISYLKRNNKTKLVFQPGTFQIKLGKDKIKEIYSNTNIFTSNKEEAEKVLGVEGKEIKEMLKMIYELGPRIVLITDSLNGAYSYDGKEFLCVKSLPHKPIESTGAGDAFSSAFVAAIILGKTISEGLMWGAINAMSVVEYVGPHSGLLSRYLLEEYFKSIPDNHKPTAI